MRFDATTAEPVPWKNGGGTTRELALQERAGKLLWRLSLADITRNGPFSAFPGVQRIHTIVEGRGLDLRSADEVLQARPLKPLRFDGGMPLDATLIGGACRAFNVIYDPAHVQADMMVFAESIRAAAGDILYAITSDLTLSDGTILTEGQGLRCPVATEAATVGSAVRLWFTSLPEDR